jgi:POT family proton-dependent oligopeptide transporter
VYLPSSSYWGFNPVWIIILGPILSRLYRALGKYDPSIPMKFGLGIILMGVGYYFITLGIHFSNKAGVISSWWIIGSYGFQAMAELFVSALGNGLASRYAPKHLVGIMIGLWFLTTSLGGIISGKLASLAAVDPHTQDPMVTLAIYQHAFFNYGNIALVIGLIGCACAPLIMWLSRERPIQ